MRTDINVYIPVIFDDFRMINFSKRKLLPKYDKLFLSVSSLAVTVYHHQQQEEEALKQLSGID